MNHKNQGKINENNNNNHSMIRENNIFLEEENIFLDANIEGHNLNEINSNSERKKDHNIQELIKNLSQDDTEMNFLFQKLDKNIKHPFFNLLNLFKIEYLENLDNEKILNHEHSSAFSIFLNEMQNQCYKRFLECFELYFEKHNIKDRLKNNSRLIMLKIIFDSMNINPGDFINKVKTYEEDENNEFSTMAIIKKLTQEKIANLKNYKEKLSLELENLRNSN